MQCRNCDFNKKRETVSLLIFRFGLNNPLEKSPEAAERSSKVNIFEEYTIF